MNLKQLLKQMTLEQKLAQLSQYNANCLHVGVEGDVTGPAGELSLTKDQVSAVGSTLNYIGADMMKEIQDEHMENDPNKIPMLFMQDVVHGYKTIYPIPLALGASFDEDLVEECSRMAAKESAVGGVHVAFGPMVDLVRDPRWGRCMETTGEDPYLNCQMSKATVRGYQGKMKGKYDMAACVKHFAAYGGAEAGRDYNTVDMSERTLRDYYLPAYKAAVDEKVEMVMTSFNLLNGVPSSGNKWLMNDILRKEWGFKGIVISDYNAIREMKEHGYCETEMECAEKSIKATTDIEMMSATYLQQIPTLIENKKISIKEIDKAVMRVLKLKEKMGLFENPYLSADAEEENRICLSPAHREIARKAAEKSAVLLKNDGVLPFSTEVKKVGVIGPFADKGMIGFWACHGKAEEAVSVAQGIKNLLPDAQVEIVEGCSSKMNETDISSVQDAVELAKTCDAVVICVGETAEMSGEGNSRAEIRLSLAQQTLIREVAKVNAKTAVVLFNGRPLVLEGIINDMPALVDAWQPGTEGGSAIANLLFGKVNFSAKLPMTFPKSEGQIPIYYNSYNTGRPKGDDSSDAGYCSRYQDMGNLPLFPFGYGLSYTDFEISAPKLSASAMRKKDKIKVSVTVKNTGAVDGETVVQLYIRDDFASLVRPVKELKGYKKVFVKAGGEKEVTFKINEEMLRFWTAKNKFESEKGTFTVWVSDCSNSGEGVKFELVK